MATVDPTWIRPEPGWTCPECGFAFDACDPTGTPGAVRAFGAKYRVPLARGLPGEDLDALLRIRPRSGAWSALEYACHVRDAFAAYDHRIATVLAEDRPTFSRLDRDRVAVDSDYNAQRAANVVDALDANAGALADRLASVPADGWARIGVREDLEMSVEWMARNAVHEGSHHLLDIGRVLRAARQAGAGG
jgi:DinB superfamily